MVVDVSHVSDKTFWDTIEVVNKPLMASHSSSWEICKHPRNVKDDMLKAVDKKIKISDIWLDYKDGGRSGKFVRD